MAVDPVSGHLYLDDQSSVVEWDTGGLDGYDVPARFFGRVSVRARPCRALARCSSRGVPAQQGGIAVNGASGEIYVLTRRTARCTCSRATPPAVAAATRGERERNGRDVARSIDPRGVRRHLVRVRIRKGAPARSRFAAGYEFSAPVTAFAHSAPVCADGGADRVGHELRWGYRPISAALSRGLLYYFRLVAGNADGTSSERGYVRDRRCGLWHLAASRSSSPERRWHPRYSGRLAPLRNGDELLLQH